MIVCRILLYYCIVIALEYEWCMSNVLLRHAYKNHVYLPPAARLNMLCISQHTPWYAFLHRHDPPDNVPPLWHTRLQGLVSSALPSHTVPPHDSVTFGDRWRSWIPALPHGWSQSIHRSQIAHLQFFGVQPMPRIFPAADGTTTTITRERKTTIRQATILLIWVVMMIYSTATNINVLKHMNISTEGQG